MNTFAADTRQTHISAMKKPFHVRQTHNFAKHARVGGGVGRLWVFVELREKDTDGRSPTELALNFYGTTRLFDDRSYARQAKACTPTVFPFCRKERFGGLADDGFRHSEPLIDDRDGDVVPQWKRYAQSMILLRNAD